MSFRKRAQLLVLLVAGPAFTEPLWQWLSERGGDGCVEGKSVGGLRGLAVKKAVKKGEVILQVPLRCTLGDGCKRGDSGDETPVAAGPGWAKKLPWNVQLALGVLERRKDPEWSAFLDSWPAAPALPKDLEEEELEEAQDEDLEVKAGGTCFWLEDRYEDAREAYEAAESDSFPWSEEDFRWALAHVWSRCLRLDLGSQRRRLLVPLLDLGNHDSNPSASFEHLPSERAVCLVALRDMQPEDAVTYSYGEHPNEHFLLYYGFVPAENPYDFVNVTFSKVLSFLPGYDETLDLKEFGGVLLRANAPDVSLLQVLHAVLREAGDDDAAAQARVLKAIAQVCRGLEQEYPTTAEEDETILQDPSKSAGAVTLVQWRLSRKQLLRRLGKSMEELATLMEEDKELAERKLKAAVTGRSSTARRAPARGAGSSGSL
ncbi:unnamed protein product [Cladocopium goreaui]|uniref:Histone-lysine N-methyltransferase setd3 n=1 Tax=Cladocopium goreaui TaxID=2562237 RepID=A0A9P1GRR4_9DINO|nr:unnamed protein product [Cladocopium goreaui]